MENKVPEKIRELRNEIRNYRKRINRIIESVNKRIDDMTEELRMLSLENAQIQNYKIQKFQYKSIYDKIENYIKSYYELDDIRLVSRKREYVYAKQLIIYLGYEFTKLTHEELAIKFYKNHSSTDYSIGVIKDCLSYDNKVIHEVLEHEKNIKESLNFEIVRKL